MLAEAQRVEAIPMKRTALPQTDYLEHDEIETLFKTLPRHGCLSLRDRGIFMVLYNTGARVQEIADLRIADVDLDGPLRIRLHGKGDKWRSCPLWPETVRALKAVLRKRKQPKDLAHSDLVFITRYGFPWTGKAKKGDSPITKRMAKLLKKLNLRYQVMVLPR